MYLNKTKYCVWPGAHLLSVPGAHQIDRLLSVLIEPEQTIEKADYKCGKSFYLDPFLDTYKKKIIENPIVDKILEMIAKANIERLDFGLKQITKDYSHVLFTNETKYQNYKPDPDSKTKIIYSCKLFQYGDMVGIRWC